MGTITDRDVLTERETKALRALAVRDGASLDCYSVTEGSAGERFTTDLEGFRHNLTSGDIVTGPNKGVDLSEFRGVFADGYTDHDINRILPRLSDKLKMTVVCFWDEIDPDDGFFRGDSFLAIADANGLLRDLPKGLEALLDGDGDGIIRRDAGDVIPSMVALNWRPTNVVSIHR